MPASAHARSRCVRCVVHCARRLQAPAQVRIGADAPHLGEDEGATALLFGAAEEANELARLGREHRLGHLGHDLARLRLVPGDLRLRFGLVKRPLGHRDESLLGDAAAAHRAEWRLLLGLGVRDDLGDAPAAS